MLQEPMSPLPSHPDDPRLDQWYHTIELAPGLVTRGFFDHRGCVDRVGIPKSLFGKTALDVGTSDGFWAFEMERRGADRVVAVDVPRESERDYLPRIHAEGRPGWDDLGRWTRRFATAHAMRRSRVEYRFCNIYDLSPERVGRFDVVYCGSLLLHLQNPLGALIAIRSVTRELAIIETGAIEEDVERQYPDRPYVFFGHLHAEDRPGANNVFWGFSTKALCHMLLYAGFSSAVPHDRFIMDDKHPVVSVLATV